jgi:protein involved in polysaccharide export with SLBB domain
MRKSVFFILLGLLPVLTFAQGKEKENKADAAVPVSTEVALQDLNPQLAMSNPDYRVTAGDIYTLAYTAAGTQINYRIMVDTTYRIRVSNLGVINGTGKTFLQLKNEAEAIITNNYPLSGVQLALTRPAVFTIYLRGEVKNAEEQPAWALSRLSSFLTLSGNLTPYSSLRDVTVTSSGGRTGTYDLFRAQHEGDLAQDPYVRPGDVITVNRTARVVRVSGAVERPGNYQLLAGEELGDVIRRYGKGLTPLADPSRIELVRYVESGNDSGKKIFLNRRDIDANYGLNHLDSIYIPAVTDLMPVMFVEGAVRYINRAEEKNTSLSSLEWEDTPNVSTQLISSLEREDTPNVSTRLTVRYNKGENYAALVQRNQEWFSAVSDTQNAYVIRGEERIAMNLNPMLYDMNYRSMFYVEENDTLIVPFRQYFVTVAGSVAAPGRYPYIPDRTWEYYVALAGGFVRERNSNESVVIQDIYGKRLRKGEIITPETTITARTNGFLYYFKQWGPVVTTALSVVTTFISVMAATGNL